MRQRLVRLRRDLGANLPGVAVILDMLDRLTALQRDVNFWFAAAVLVAALAALTSGEPIPMTKAGPLAPVLDALLRIDPVTRLDSVRASLMLARVAAGATSVNSVGG